MGEGILLHGVNIYSNRVSAVRSGGGGGRNRVGAKSMGGAQ